MAIYNKLPKDRLVRTLLAKGKEGDFWDFKLKWHDKIEDLVKDIVCFANTVHDKDCYLIFGISDDLKIVGLNEERRKQADIIDTISHLSFAGDVRPQISVETLSIEEKEIDVLTIYNINQTPIYLKTTYGSMHRACIYVRTGDKNTPDKDCADIRDIEALWKKRLGLFKAPLDYAYDQMHDKRAWSEHEQKYFLKMNPLYTLRLVDDSDVSVPPFYSLVMMNPATHYYNLKICFNNTVIDRAQVVSLDSSRLLVPVPDREFINVDGEMMHFSPFYYYIKETPTYVLFKFFYDDLNHEARIACDQLLSVIPLFESTAEYEAFKEFLEKNIDRFQECLKEHWSEDKDLTEQTALNQKQLSISKTFKKLLDDWRSMAL